MILTPRHFVRFIDGRAGDVVVVAFLPGQLGAYLGTTQTEIKLRRDYALKLFRRKADYSEFSEIQNTVDFGTCLISKDNHLSFVHVRDKVRPVVYFLLIKTTAARDEIWLVTFHRLKGSQIRRRANTGTIIQSATEEFEE